MNDATYAFILKHREDDVRRLALREAGRLDVDMPLALQQIAGWQVARRKVPTWAANDSILYPPHLNMEQCSSEATARYKGLLLAANSPLQATTSPLQPTYSPLQPTYSPLQPPPTGGGFVDLTGGWGVDFFFMAGAANEPQQPQMPQEPQKSQEPQMPQKSQKPQMPQKPQKPQEPQKSQEPQQPQESQMPQEPQPPTYVEQNAELCELARHNFRVLGLECRVVCGSAADVLPTLPHMACIYLDPARRDEHGGRTYALKDCTPNVLQLLPLLSEKADHIILKLSPMLDWHQAVEELNAAAQREAEEDSVGKPPSAVAHAVHIVSVGNECKELIVEVRGARCDARDNFEVRRASCDARDYIRVHCVNILPEGATQHFSYLAPRTSHLETKPPHLETKEQKASPSRGRLEGAFLYEPNASIMKAGCFDEMANFYHVREISRNSHLFVSDEEVKDFPGRSFHVEQVCSMNKRELKEALRGMDQANITTRNFPISVAELRKRLRLKDGGDCYIFATTAADGSHQLYICRKIA